ncbi:hypothetical protein LIZ84_04315 [Roseburia faecis]|nr:hypothetical protein [Roseburia sp.]MCB6947074.1 hypothetical protein [Roseburia faecis]
MADPKIAPQIGRYITDVPQIRRCFREAPQGPTVWAPHIAGKYMKYVFD